MTQKSAARLARDDKDAATRSIAEIDAEYGKTCALAGDAAYKIKVLELNLNQLQQKLWDLNQEAERRRKLDAAASAVPVTPTPYAPTGEPTPSKEVG